MLNSLNSKQKKRLGSVIIGGAIGGVIGGPVGAVIGAAAGSEYNARNSQPKRNTKNEINQSNRRRHI